MDSSAAMWLMKCFFLFCLASLPGSSNGAITADCTETGVSIMVPNADQIMLGVSTNDHVGISKNPVNAPASLSSPCITAGSSSTVTLTLALNQCAPDVTQDTTCIYFKWYVRNVDGDDVKRADVCFEVTCKYDRWVTGDYGFTASVTKATLAPVTDTAIFTSELQIYDTSARDAGQVTEFLVPNIVYGRFMLTTVSITSFYVQIETCFATPGPLPSSTPRYNIIANGSPVTTDSGLAAAVEPYAVYLNDFEFVSFCWTDRTLGTDVYIHCEAYVCQNDATDVDCAITAPPVGPGRRRRRALGNELIEKASVGPLTFKTEEIQL